MAASGRSGSIEDVDASDLSAVLEAYAANARDLSPAMAVVAEMLVAEVNDKFQAEGPGWPGLAKSTIAKRRGSVAQILQDTGRLAASIHGTSGPDFAEASTDVSYAVFHVSDGARTKIPLRDFFDLPDRVYDDALEIILDALVAA